MAGIAWFLRSVLVEGRMREGGGGRGRGGGEVTTGEMKLMGSIRREGAFLGQLVTRLKQTRGSCIPKHHLQVVVPGLGFVFVFVFFANTVFDNR